MHKSSLLMLVVMAALSACKTPTEAPAPAKVAAAAPAASPAAKTASAAAPDDPNQKVCVREEVTGSRLPPARECHTRAEWAQRKANGDEHLQLIGAGPNAGAMQSNGR